MRSRTRTVGIALLLCLTLLGLSGWSNRATAGESRAVVLVAGPGGRTYGRSEVTDLQKALEKIYGAGNVSVAGDGEAPVYIETVLARIKKVAESSRPPLIIMLTHNAESKGHQYFALGEDFVDVDDFIKHVANIMADRPVDTLAMGCFTGGCALPVKNRLAMGSKFAGLTPSDDRSSFIDIREFIKYLASSSVKAGSDLSLEDLLYDYLLAALRHPISPVIVTGQGEVLKLEQVANALLSQPMTEDKARRIHQALDPLIGRETVLAFLEQLASIRSARDVTRFSVGKVYAVALASASPRGWAAPDPSGMAIEVPSLLEVKNECEILAAP